MSEFLDWLVLLGPWSFFLCVWLALTVLGLLVMALASIEHRDLPLEHHVRRGWCKRFGHVPVAEERGRPVTAFNLCIRCGKILERIP